MATWKKQRTQREQEEYDKRLGLNQEEQPKETETDGEAWLKGQEAEARDRGTIRFLYFIIFCVFVFIASLAANDAPSPSDTYPFRDPTPYFILGD